MDWCLCQTVGFESDGMLMCLARTHTPLPHAACRRRCHHFPSLLACRPPKTPTYPLRNCQIAAHGNSLRALVKHLDGIPDDTITGLNIPTGIPLVYELDENFKVVPSADAIAPLQGHYLGDKEVRNCNRNSLLTASVATSEGSGVSEALVCVEAESASRSCPALTPSHPCTATTSATSRCVTAIVPVAGQ
jgi:hypothetical protein